MTKATERAQDYAVRLFLNSLNERYQRAFAPTRLDGPLFEANDPEAGRVVLYVIELFEASEEYLELADQLSERLDQTRPGSYVLWVPPGGELPKGEPDESEFIRRVVLSASKLASGRSGEVRLATKLAIGKVRDEGGYASVTGGLGRHWTEIAGRLTGSYYLDSRGLKRFTTNEEEREELYDHIAMTSQALTTGDIMEFEHEDAWSVQRLPRSGAAGTGMEDGWTITGSPEGFDPNDGAAVRRTLRRKLQEATTKLGSMKGAAKGLVLIGGYDYITGENAGPSLRGFDPALTAPFDMIGLVSDAEVKPLRMSRSLSFAQEGPSA